VPRAERAAAGARVAPRVHRADRLRDWIALGAVLLGAALYAAANAGMGALARDRSPTTAAQAARNEWKMVRWNRYERLSRVGITLVVVGATVSVWSFARHAKRRRETANAQ
jgi:hypothetical protein